MAGPDRSIAGDWKVTNRPLARLRLAGQRTRLTRAERRPRTTGVAAPLQLKRERNHRVKVPEGTEHREDDAGDGGGY